MNNPHSIARRRAAKTRADEIRSGLLKTADDLLKGAAPQVQQPDDDANVAVADDDIAARIVMPDEPAKRKAKREVPKERKPHSFDPKHNVLDGEIKDDFVRGISLREDQLSTFTQPISTTNTMEGYISNVSFKEYELIHKLEASREIVLMVCNFGDPVKYEHYTVPTKEKSSRGRKKQDKPKKNRRYQGTGKAFNSQITFVVPVPSIMAKLPDDGPIPVGTPVHKFKVFRNGKMQLPGVRQNNVEDVIASAQIIAAKLNDVLHGEDELKSELVNINPVMKNYKFAMMLRSNQLLNLAQLHQLIRTNSLQMGAKQENETFCPTLYTTKWTRQDTKLSVKFFTPIPNNPKKTTRVNIFMRGKINILGAFDHIVTEQICRWLCDLINANRDTLVETEGVVDEELEENIADFDEMPILAERAQKIMDFDDEMNSLDELIGDESDDSESDDDVEDETCED